MEASAVAPVIPRASAATPEPSPRAVLFVKITLGLLALVVALGVSGLVAEGILGRLAWADATSRYQRASDLYETTIRGLAGDVGSGVLSDGDAYRRLIVADRTLIDQLDGNWPAALAPLVQRFVFWARKAQDLTNDLASSSSVNDAVRVENGLGLITVNDRLHELNLLIRQVMHLPPPPDVHV